MAECRKDIQATRPREVTLNDKRVVDDDMKIITVCLLFN